MGELPMDRVSFKTQMILGLIFLFLMHICSTVFKNGIFVNIAWITYGLLFVMNPVCPEKAKSVKNIHLWIRLAGLLCIIGGVITRFGV